MSARSPVTMPHPFTAAQRAKARQLREGGATIKAICREMNCGEVRLYRNVPELRPVGTEPKTEPKQPRVVIDPHGHTLTDAEKAEIRRLAAEGLTAVQIAKRIKREAKRIVGYLGRLEELRKEQLPNVAGPRRFVNAAMTEPLREKPWTPPRG